MEAVTVKVIQVKYTGIMTYRSFVRDVIVPAEEVVKSVNEMDFLELVFKYGQNDFQSKQSPSVSIGDVAIVGNKFYLCETMGWSEIKQVA